MARSVPLSRFTLRVGGGSAFYVRRCYHTCMNSTLTAAAGEHYVAYKLSCLGFLAAFVRQGSPTTDLLASSLDGARTVAIQVKTTILAGRTRGRGSSKIPHHLEFPLGHAAVERSSPKLVFCFVDLRDNQSGISPDVYVVPASEIQSFYEGQDIRQYSYFRHHPKVERMEPFKNNWQPIIEALS